MEQETLKLTNDFVLDISDEKDTSFEKTLQLDKYGIILEVNNKTISITSTSQNMLINFLKSTFIDKERLYEQLKIASETQHTEDNVYLITDRLGCEDINIESARECNCVLYALNDSYFNIKSMNYIEVEDITYMKKYTEIDEEELE